jgi:hypothetical protein
MIIRELTRRAARDCFIAIDGLLNDPHILGVEPVGGIVTDEFCVNQVICAGHLRNLDVTGGLMVERPNDRLMVATKTEPSVADIVRP